MTKILLTLFLCTYVVGSEDATARGIQKFVAPDYPVVARQAQISGDVRLRINVGSDGTIESATVLSGPAILAEHARKNVLTWRFDKQSRSADFEVIYHYRLREPKRHGDVVPLVSLESPMEVVIISNLPMPSGHPE